MLLSHVSSLDEFSLGCVLGWEGVRMEDQREREKMVGVHHKLGKSYGWS